MAARESDRAASAFWKWKYRHYFKYIGLKDEKNIEVKCTLCVGNSKSLSTSRISTGNLKKHLEKKHHTTTLVARAVKGNEDSDENNNDADGGPASKQQRLDLTTSLVTQREINDLVAGYVVERMLPLSTVEAPSFRKIISKIPMARNKQGSLPDRKTFSSYLDKAYCDMEKELKSTFEGLEYVSTTADLWTQCNKSFMGMTAHWIDPSTLQRKKAGLACKRVMGRHTYDVIAAEIEQIHTSYGLSGKVTATVTDNGSNFVKAFQVYQEEQAAPGGSDSGSESEGDANEDVTFADLHTVLSTVDEDGETDTFVLPPHHRCASHTLNLIANDIEKCLLSNSEAKALYRSATAKCCGLWTKASRSSVASESVSAICKRKLLVPSKTRWNSFYDSLRRVIDNPIADLNRLCTELGIRCFSEREYQFVKEYCQVVKPLTIALDILQGEDNCFHGTILPTLDALMARTLGLKDTLSRVPASLPDFIVEVIIKYCVHAHST